MIDLTSVLAHLEMRGIHTDSFARSVGNTPEERLAWWIAEQLEWQGQALTELSAKLRMMTGGNATAISWGDL
jgi:hypothetical protein